MPCPKHISTTIRDLLLLGKRATDIARSLGCAKSTVTYHAKKLGITTRTRPVYDWKEINTYHNNGHSVIECVKKFGFNKCSWHTAKIRGDVVPRDHRIPLTTLLTPGREQSRSNVKRRLLNIGLLQKVCRLCGLTEWRGKPLAFNLDHEDGDKLNWSQENLRLVCPNCDSQQSTFGGRNVGRLTRSLKTVLVN